jgi:hypothetical protein
MKKVTLKALQDYLRKKQYDASIQEETQQVFVLFKFDGREFPLFARILPEGSLLQLLVFMPTSFSKETVNDVARLLHLLNKELDLPGFGIDETAGVVFFRCMLPMHNGEIPDTVLDAFLNSMELVCKTFSPAIEAVASGAATYDEILKRAQEQIQRNQGQ